MSFSRHLSRLQLHGITKAGDILIPGDSQLPAFSRTGAIVRIDHMLDYLNTEDLSGFKALTGLFGLLPRFMIRLVLQLSANVNQFPRPLAAPLRMLNLGMKGVIMTLYYSDSTSDGKIHRELGWDAHAGPDARSGSNSAKAIFNHARAAQLELRRLGVSDRLRFISALKQAILTHQDRIMDLVQKETGKSRIDALTSEIFGVLDHLAWLEKFAAKSLRDQKIYTPPALMGKKSMVFLEPMGTVLVISPWNYPFYQAIVPITSAFVCGNAVIYKPSEITPLRGLVELMLSEAGFLSDWVQIVYGDADCGRQLIAERPDKIFFTGSTRAGKQIMEQASRMLIPVELELGGKDPMIVFEDANISRAVAGALWGAMTNTGQSCTSVERLLIHESIYDRFRDELVEGARRISMGIDVDGSKDMGAMTNDAQTGIVSRQMADARTRGARIVSGGDWDGKSRTIPPILIEEVLPGMDVYSQETFGPILPLMRFGSEEEAIRLANDSEYGLSASVWTKDLKRAERVARALVTGNVSVNNVMITEGNHALPFGGVKNSGFGRYKGQFGLYSFSNVKAVMMEKSSGKIEANWYPYTPEKLRLFKQLMAALFGGKGVMSFIRFAIAGLKLEAHTAKIKKNR